MPDRLAAALAEAGALPPPVALLRLLSAAADEAVLRDALEQALRNGRTWPAAVLALWQEHPAAYGLVREVLGQAVHDRVDSSPDATLRRWSAVFDRLAATRPDAGVALYALGDPVLLAEATGEIVTQLRSWDLLSPDAIVLDLGCGTGRVAAALQPQVGFVAGLDLSEGMLREAGRRHPGLPLLRGSGHDLACLRDGAFDLVVAADVMPYLVQAGGDLAARLLAETARVLAPDGRLVVLNWSYGGDAPALEETADAAGLVTQLGPLRPFRLWDAQAWLLRPRLPDDV